MHEHYANLNEQAISLPPPTFPERMKISPLPEQPRNETFTNNLMWSLLKEFLKFARQEKKWWLIPLVLLLLVVGAIIIFGGSAGISWMMYPFF